MDIRKRQLAGLIARCWLDADFKKTLVTNPIETLADFKISLTSGMRVQVIFDTETYFHLVLASPPWVVPTHLTLFPYLEDDVPTRQRILGELNVRLWETPELKSRLMASPKEFLTGEGLEFADGLTVKILENSARKMFLPIPFQPSKLDPENGLEFARGLAASRIQGVLRSKLY